jgi:alanine dehydrogenase
MVHPLDGINAMRIGVSRIVKNDEYQLVVESDAQLRSCLTDEKYDASVAFSSQSSEIFCSESDLNVKVLKLQAPEYARLRAGQILLDTLLCSQPNLWLTPVLI